MSASRVTGLLLVLPLLLLGAEGLSAARPKAVKSEDLFNPLLGPDYALFLVGPVSRMATREETDAFLRLSDDAAAKAFVDAFWAKRDPEPAYEGNPLRERFEERVREVDRRFAEAGVPGRRTDRGTTWILYGPPSETRFDIPEHPDDPPIEVWLYDADAKAGLDGKQPERQIRFIKRGELTTFFTANIRPPRPRLRTGPP